MRWWKSAWNLYCLRWHSASTTLTIYRPICRTYEALIARACRLVRQFIHGLAGHTVSRSKWSESDQSAKRLTENHDYRTQIRSRVSIKTTEEYNLNLKRCHFSFYLWLRMKERGPVGAKSMEFQRWAKQPTSAHLHWPMHLRRIFMHGMRIKNMAVKDAYFYIYNLLNQFRNFTS